MKKYEKNFSVVKDFSFTTGGGITTRDTINEFSQKVHDGVFGEYISHNDRFLSCGFKAGPYSHQLKPNTKYRVKIFDIEDADVIGYPVILSFLRRQGNIFTGPFGLVEIFKSWVC